MDELKELVSVVNRNKVKSLKTLDSKETDRVTDFYQRLLQDEFKTEDNAAKFYFGKNAQYSGYRRLRNKLKERLWNSIVFIDINSPKFNDAQKAFYTCQKNLIIIRTLLGRYARKSAIDLLRRTLKYSTKYELSEVSLELYRFMRNHHAVKTGNKTQFDKYYKLVKEFENIVRSENLAFEYYDEISLELVRQSGPSKNYFDKAKEAIDDLSQINVDTFRFILFSKNITCNYHLNRRDYRSLLVQAEEALIALNDKEHVSSQFTAQFHFLKLIAYTQLGEFESGQKIYTYCTKIFESGTTRWYNSHDIYFLLLMRNRRYESLINVYDAVTNNPTFKYQPDKRKETWRMNEAYIFYLHLIGKVEIPIENRLSKFRVSKFLNNLPVFSMDKVGYNIPILIIQICILIRDKKYDQLTDKIESIEKYSTRYLRKDNNFRSNCFIKMLLQIPKRQFHQRAVQRHAKTYYTKLKSVPLSKANQSFEIEIIPYETLWEYVLESLDNRFH